MSTLASVRSLLEPGTNVECVEHTRQPELVGQRYRILTACKARLQLEALDSERPPCRDVWVGLPARAGDVLELTDTRVRYRSRDGRVIVALVHVDQPAHPQDARTAEPNAAGSPAGAAIAIPPELAPDLALIVKLASIARHVQEGTGAGASPLDLQAARALTEDPQVSEWLAAADSKGLLPVAR